MILSASEIIVIVNLQLNDERTRNAFGMFFKADSSGLTLDGGKVVLIYNETWNIVQFYINCVESPDF